MYLGSVYRNVNLTIMLMILLRQTLDTKRRSNIWMANAQLNYCKIIE